MSNTTLLQAILQAIAYLNPTYGEVLHVAGVNKGLLRSETDYQQDLIDHRQRAAF